MRRLGQDAQAVRPYADEDLGGRQQNGCHERPESDAAFLAIGSRDINVCMGLALKHATSHRL
jgi:hypothetical protein